MSKKKKVRSDMKVVQQKSQKLKGVHKEKNKHSAGRSKIKNKQNIRDSVLSKSKSKQNIKDNIKAKFKHKQSAKDNAVPKFENKQKIKDGNIQRSKKDNLLKKLNVHKLSAMLNAKESKTSLAVKKKEATPLSLRQRMLAQLRASRFRFLNEQLYSNASSDSKKYFQDDPHAFNAYHEGYKQQVERWPLNPVDVIIESIKKMPKEYTIADFGCGEAKLADSVPQKVHSFDLVAVNDKVQACDMANTPLLTGRVDVVVFCLSLMGSNLGDYLLEANRVLNKDGIVKIAEVESRFDKIEDFIKTMSHYGFNNTWKDLSNNLFYFMDFKKTKDVLKKDVKKLPSMTLKSCMYKKR